MKKIIFITISLATIFINCRKPNFLPMVGAVEGTVLNIHNEPIVGAEVKIIHVPASESTEAEERTISTTTDFEGKFLLEDIWDEFRIDVVKSGFEGQTEHHEIRQGSFEQSLDFTLIGSPEASAIILDRTTLSESDTTELTVLVTVQDAFNETPSGYSGNLMITDQNGVLQSVLSLSAKAEGIGTATLEANLFSGSLEASTYDVSASISDPDGNRIISSTEQQLTVE